MARRVVGIYAAAAPLTWGPWRERPCAVVPAALADAVRRSGALVVVLASDPLLQSRELLRTLDALIVCDASIEPGHLAELLQAARDDGLAVAVLDCARVTPASTMQDYERELAALGVCGRTSPDDQRAMPRR